MKNLADLFAEQRGRFEDGRTQLSQLQEIFDEAFGKQACTVAQRKSVLVVYVGSAGQATEVQMSKHSLVSAIKAVDPTVSTIRVTIGKPRE